MGKFKLKIEELAEGHFKKHIKSGNKATVKKIERILVDLSETPYLGIGNPEALSMSLRGFGQEE